MKPPQDPTFALIQYHDEAERDRKIASLLPSVKPIICISYKAPSIEQWQRKVNEDNESRLRERETEHPTPKD